MFKPGEVPPVIRLKNLSKQYVVYPNPAYWLVNFLRLGHWLKEGQHYRSYWALRDVNLEIPAGSKIALVGRNGAGKSTLLRLICGITASTSGVVEVNGRCEGLLQLGVGFNAEFTGRENVYIALAYQGITGEAAHQKFQEVVDFAELDNFIEQPVRTFSSGMYLRLAFSVATVLNPDILIIDEVLATGDAYFQAKCLTRIEELTSGPKATILFVSHDLDAAQRLCDTFIWIDQGRIMAVGPSMQVRQAYEHSIRQQRQVQIHARNLGLRHTFTNLQINTDAGTHLLGQFRLENSNSKVSGPHIKAIRLFTRGNLTEEIRVGEMADGAGQQASFIINDSGESFWGSSQQHLNQLTRTVQPGLNGQGAKFVIFLAPDDFTASDFQLELEVIYQDSSALPCYLELSAGQVGLQPLLTLEHTMDNTWKSVRVTIPKWIYTSPGYEEKSFPTQQHLNKVETDGRELNNTIRPEQQFGTGQVVIKKVQFLNELGEDCYLFRLGQKMSVVLAYQTQDLSLVGSNLIWSVVLQRIDGVRVASMLSSIQDHNFTVQPTGKLCLTFTPLMFTKGVYWVTMGLFSKLDLFGFNLPPTDNPALYHLQRQAYQFEVEGSYRIEAGMFRPPVNWEVIE